MRPSVQTAGISSRAATLAGPTASGASRTAGSGGDSRRRSGVAGWIEPDGTARVVAARTAAWTARVTESEPLAYASSADARLLVFTPGNGATRVFRTAKQQLVKALPDSDVAVFDPAGLQLAIESRDSTVIWDVARVSARGCRRRNVGRRGIQP